MTEESLALGRPPRGTGRGRGRWGRRGPGIVVTLALVGLTGWAVWRGVFDDGSTTPPPGRAATAAATAHLPAPASDPPAEVPYLRSGTLVRPAAPAVRLPTAAWTDFAVLADGSLVLVQHESVTVLTSGRPRTFWLAATPAAGISARPDGLAVAWTGPDGRVRRLSAGDARPTVLPDVRQLSPPCRGLAVGISEWPGWQGCDRDGRLLSPGGAWSASIGEVSVSLLPRLDPGGGTSAAFLGVVDDAVWEDPAHLLVVVRLGGEAHLVRVGTDGTSQDVIAPVHGADDPARHTLVLPATSPWVWMQP